MPNVLITGCSRGIGKQLVLQYLQHSSNKIIGISRNPDIQKSEFWQTDIDQKFLPITFDLLEISEKSEFLLKRITEFIDSIDILINNAGILINKPFENYSFKEIMYQLETNLVAPSLLIQTLLPLLKKSTNAHIINIGSMGGFQGSSKYVGLSWYSASKAALACMSECLAEEFKMYGIKVNCLALGAVETEMLQLAFPEYKAPVNAQNIAEFIIYFAENGHRFFNGKVLPVALGNP